MELTFKLQSCVTNLCNILSSSYSSTKQCTKSVLGVELRSGRMVITQRRSKRRYWCSKTWKLDEVPTPTEKRTHKRESKPLDQQMVKKDCLVHSGTTSDRQSDPR